MSNAAAFNEFILKSGKVEKSVSITYSWLSMDMARHTYTVWPTADFMFIFASFFPQTTKGRKKNSNNTNRLLLFHKYVFLFSFRFFFNEKKIYTENIVVSPFLYMYSHGLQWKLDKDSSTKSTQSKKKRGSIWIKK